MLASASPRRQALMRVLGLDWCAAAAEIDEQQHLLADPFVSALNVALAKARAVATLASDDVVVAADTIVAAENTALGKPSDEEAARRMLTSLRGRAHEVLTGVAMRSANGREWGGVVSSRVVMRAYDDAEIAMYVARGEPFDKAGGYAVQDTEFRPVERCEGCYLNVVGLPLCAVAAGLQALGVEVPTAPADLRPPCSYCHTGAPLVSIAAQ